MIHLANGWNGSAVTSFFNQIFIAGQFATGDFDLFGFSFYPFYGTGATYSALKSSMQAVVTKFNKVRSSNIVERTRPHQIKGRYGGRD